MSNENTNELTVIIDKAGLVDETKLILTNSFSEFNTVISEWRTKAQALIVTDASQLIEMSDARKARLALVKVRTGIADKHKELKSDTLKYSQTLDLIKRTLTAEIEPIEAHLLEQEEFAKRIEEKRLIELKTDREALLFPYGVDTQFLDLMKMPQANFDSLLENSRLAHEAKIAEAGRLEDERIENERKEKLLFDRTNEIRLYTSFMVAEDGVDSIGEWSQERFDSYLQLLATRKEAHEAKHREIEAENERLREEHAKMAREANEKAAMKMERRKKMGNYLRFIDDHQSAIDASDEDFEKIIALAIVRTDEFNNVEKLRLDEEAKREEEYQKALDEKNRIKAELDARKKAEDDARLKAEQEAEDEKKLSDSKKFDLLMLDLEEIREKVVDYAFKSKKFKDAQTYVISQLNATINNSIAVK